MEFRIYGEVVFIRMFPGEDYVQSLIDASCEIGARNLILLSSIGQIRGPTLGYFVEKGDYSPETFDGVFELLSVSGNMTGGGKGHIPHLHAVMGRMDKSVIGGHLISGTVEVTNETVLLISDIPSTRSLNDATGLMDLVP